VRAELGALAGNSDALQVFVDAYQQRMAELQKRENTTALAKKLREARRKLANVTEAFAEMQQSAAIRERHQEQEGIVSQLEHRIAETRRRVVIPHPAAIVGELRDLLRMMGKDVPRARADLARLMPQPLRMIPGPHEYIIEGGSSWASPPRISPRRLGF
jgi:predicted nuclease with TOPRIM domain